jgi:VanZ family protein
MAAIFVASSIPNLTHIPGGFSDTAAHVASYAVLSLLLVRALARARWSRVTLRAALAAAALSVMYGVTDEWHQRFVAGRTFELADLAADGAGALAAGVAAWARGMVTSGDERRMR